MVYEKKKRNFRKLALIFAVLVGLLLILNYLVLPFYVSSAEISVPNVIGLEQQEAMNKLEDAGLNPMSGDTVFDAKTKKGLVLRQRPFPNTVVKSGRRVYLIISGGKPLIQMPMLVGRTIAEAKFILERNSLLLGEITFVPADAAKGVVIKQSVISPLQVERGTKIALSVSSGIEEGTIEAPTLVGMTEKAAIQMVQSMNLQIGKKNYQISPGILPGTIMEQYPLPGQKVNPGSKIDLFISKDNVTINE